MITLRVTNTIKIDFTSPGIPPKITAITGDVNARQLHVLLFDGGAAFQAPANASAVVRYRRSDGHGGAYDTLPDGSSAITWNDNRSEMDVVLAPAVAAAPGGIILDVLISTPDAQLATFSVLLEILKNPSIGTEPDPDDYYKITSFAGFTQALERMLPKAGGTMSGDLGLDGNKLYFGQSVWAYESEQGVLRLEGDGAAPVLRGIDDPVKNSDVVTLGYFNAHKGGGGGGSVDIDTTLTVSGAAADAKAVGDALNRKQAAGDNVEIGRLKTLHFASQADGVAAGVTVKTVSTVAEAPMIGIIGDSGANVILAGVASPTGNAHAANKQYVDSEISKSIGSIDSLLATMVATYEEVLR